MVDNAAPPEPFKSAKMISAARDSIDRKFSIAPMMDWSDRHCRYFWRLMSAKALLYTEMVVTGAILHGDRARFLSFNKEEHPVALQLGGSNPEELAICAKIGEDWGYDEINLNCGCPSDRVQKGMIGAVLMHEPDLVADCVSRMIDATTVPITVKHRIGVDNSEDYPFLHRFVTKVSAAGCTTFIVHARKAWLKGLSPKENREIPPLQYELVLRLKRDFPHLNISINGGINNIEQIKTLLSSVDGVMVGREAYANPYLVSSVDQTLFDSDQPQLSRIEIVQRYAEYCEQQLLIPNTRLHHLTRHILGLFAGQPGGRLFRRYLSEHAPKKNAGPETLLAAVETLIR